MRIIFMGSPQFAVPSLDFLAHSKHQVVAVVTQPDRPRGRNLKLQSPPVKTAAQESGITVIQPEKASEAGFIEQVKSLAPELFVVVAYGEILRPQLLAIPSRGSVNLHASLLPSYRGAAPVARAILNGDEETGATTMLMNEEMDAGPVLLQEPCKILPEDTAGSLASKISIMGASLLLRTVDMMEKKELAPRIQDSFRISYAPKLKKEEGAVDWNRSASWISRQIRAFDPWPGTFSFFGQTRVKFWKARVLEEKTEQQPGMIAYLSPDSIFVACGENSMLEILEVQPENRQRFPAADFIHGYKPEIGDGFSINPIS